MRKTLLFAAAALAVALTAADSLACPGAGIFGRNTFRLRMRVRGPVVAVPAAPKAEAAPAPKVVVVPAAPKPAAPKAAAAAPCPTCPPAASAPTVRSRGLSFGFSRWRN